MKIERLKAENILGFDAAEFAFGGSGIVNFIAGQNGSGKSSVGDLIEFVLTGLARDLEQKGDAGFLQRGSGAMRAALTIDGQAVSRSRSGCSIKVADLQKLTGPAERISALLRASSFVEMKPAARRDLVKAVSSDSAAIREAILRQADPKVLPAHALAGVLEASLTSLDRAEKLAVDKRREAGRLLDACGVAPAPTVTIGGEDWDLTSVNHDAIKAKISKLETQKSDVLKAQGAANACEDALKKLKQQAEELDRFVFEHPDPGADRMRELRLAKDNVDKDIEFARSALTQAEAAKIAAKTAYDAVSKLEGKSCCPTCGQELDEKTMIPKRKKVRDAGNAACEQYETAKGRYETTLETTAAAVAAFDEAAESRRQASELAAVKRQIAEMEKRRPDTADIAALDSRLAVGRELMRAKQEFDVETAKQGKRGEYAAEHAAWDAIAKALGKDGEVRKLAASEFDTAPVLAWAGELLPGRRIEVRDDWEVFVDAVPAKIILSESERLRLGMCFAAGLSMASGLEILFVDRLDCLEEDLRPVVLQWLADRSEELETVICAARVAKPPQPCDWLKVWWVAGGKAEEVCAEGEDR